MGEYWRYRVGDIRIICDIADKQMCVLVIEIGNRREVYRQGLLLIKTGGRLAKPVWLTQKLLCSDVTEDAVAGFGTNLTGVS